MAQAVLWQRVEGFLLFLSGLLLFWQGGGPMPWWVAFLAFFAPDLSFFGYLLGLKAGAIGYNAVHIFAIGLILPVPTLAGFGALWLAHAGFDRLLGYGLKLPDGFGFTHLGRVGRRP